MKEGHQYERVLPDGRCISVFRLTFGRARLVISMSLESLGYEDGW